MNELIVIYYATIMARNILKSFILLKIKCIVRILYKFPKKIYHKN